MDECAVTNEHLSGLDLPEDKGREGGEERKQGGRGVGCKGKTIILTKATNNSPPPSNSPLPLATALLPLATAHLPSCICGPLFTFNFQSFPILNYLSPGTTRRGRVGGATEGEEG